MRIAVVSDAVYPFHTGGKEIRYENLMTRLSGRGHQVEIFTMQWWHDEPLASSVKYRALVPRLEMYKKGRRSILQGVVFALSCFRLLWCRADVLEADHMPYLQLFPLWLVAKTRRIPLVVTWHEYWGRGYWRTYLGPLGAIAAAIERVSICLPSHIVAVSESTASALRSRGIPKDRLTTLPNGVGLAARCESRDEYIISVGRLLRHKRMDIAISSLKILRDQGEKVRLRIIGDGPELESLKAHVGELDLVSCVEFLGNLVDQREVWYEVSRARALIAPSEREGFGLVVAEALALGTPVVISDHPDNAARHLVSPGVTGEVAESGSAAAFADSYRKVLRLDNGDVSRRFLKDHPELSWDRTVEKYERLLLDLKQENL